MVMRIGGTKSHDAQGNPQFGIDYLRPLALAEFPQSKVLSAKQAVETFKPNHRVSVEGTPLRIETRDGEPCLIMGEGDSTIAVCFQEDTEDSLASLDPKIAGRVRVAGVTKADDQYDFQLIVSRASDATLIESRTSLSRIVAIGLGVLLAICAIAAMWIKLLQSKVAQQQRFEAIFDNAGCPIIVFNGKLQIVDANQLAADMSGYSKEELRAMDITQLDRQITHEKLDVMMAQTMESQKIAIFPSKVFTKDNRQLDVEVHSRNLTKSHDPEIATHIAVFPDTTARIQYEKELEAARDEAIRANKGKSRFVASMSHELRTPLNGVIGMTQLLEKTELTPVQADYLAACRTSGETLLTVIGDVLDFSKMEVGKLELKPEETKLIPFIENVVRSTSLQKATRHVELASFVDHRLSRSVMVDADRFRQVLFNLIGNAIKFTSRGSITVTARCSEVTDQYADVSFVVADTGVGIPKDRIGCLFEAFEQYDASTTRQYGGTGLGLTICKQIVELMGGEVHARSVEGEGSEFIVDVRLPFAAHEDSRAADARSNRFVAAGQRVAVLGMSEPISKLLCEMFEEYQIEASFFDESELVPEGNFDVVLLNSNKEGLEAVEKFIAEQASLLAGDSVEAPILVPVVPANCIVKDEQWKKMGVNSPICTPFSQTRFLQAINSPCEIGAARGTERFGIERLQDRMLRILICEDVPVNQMIAEEICRGAGIECVVSDNGKSGIEVLEMDSRFDAIFMDCHMPVMDGFEATKKIREMTAQGTLPRIPIIALTANALSGDREKCLDTGMDDYLAKPFEIDQFLEKILTHVPTASPEKLPDSVHTQSTESIFDIEKLSTQVEDRSLALEFARKFTETFPEYQEELEACLESKNAEQTLQVAHRIKGTAGTLRANRISGVAARMESGARDGELQQFQSQVEELLQEFQNFSNACRQESK